MGRDAAGAVRRGTVDEAAQAGRLRLIPVFSAVILALWSIVGIANADEITLSPNEDFWHRATLSGDWGGLKPLLADAGIAVNLTDIEEVQGNVSGGIRHGSGYDGATILSLSANLDTLLGWPGGSIGLAAGELRGHGVSQFDLGNILTVSNIETQPQTRLFDLYLEQDFFDGKLTLRAGQMLPADDFASSHYAAPLINSSFNWPVLLGVDLPGDDPVGLVSTPAFFAKFDGGGAISAQIGLYKGTASSDDGPLEARASTSNGDGVQIFGEAAYTIHPSTDGPLPASFKLGGWYHSAEFDDLAVNDAGQSLVLAGGSPRRHAGDYGWYGVVDKLLYVVPGTGDQGLGSFLRVAAAPNDRNLLSLYVDVGLNYKGLLPDRPADVLGVGFAWARIGDAAASYDTDIRRFYGPDYPVRDHEAVVELTYQAMATPWWTLQPDIQYVIHPGIGTADPIVGDERIPNAVVLGLRTFIRF